MMDSVNFHEFCVLPRTVIHEFGVREVRVTIRCGVREVCVGIGVMDSNCSSLSCHLIRSISLSENYLFWI